MKFFNIKDDILNSLSKDNITTRLLDLVFSIILTFCISYAINKSLFNYNFHYAPNIVYLQFFIWVIAFFLLLSKRLFYILLTSTALIIGFNLIFDKTNGIIKYFTEFFHWFYMAEPLPYIYNHDKFGFTLALVLNVSIIFLVFIILLHNKSSFTFLVMGILGTVVFFALSVIYNYNDYNTQFIAFLFCCIWFYNKYKYDKINYESYFKFQIYKSHFFIYPAIIIIILSSTSILQYKNNNFVTFVNENIQSVTKSINNDFFSSFNNFFNNKDINKVTLGGDLKRDTTPLFRVTTPYDDIYLKTTVFDNYTGRGWDKKQDNTPFKRYSKEFQKTFPYSTYEYSDYGIEPSQYMREITLTAINYNSKYFPTPSCPRDIKNTIKQNTSIEYNQYGEGIVKDYIEKGDVFSVEYNFIGQGLQVDERYLVDTFYDTSKVDPSYLQLPNTITKRTVDLVESLKRDIDYDRTSIAYSIALVKKFTEYLKSNYRYSTTPKDEFTTDHVDSFLFENKEGYCMSFATSLTVMCRIAGIPSRYVSGYYLSPNSENQGQITVTDYQKHAWCEVYYPEGYWLAFEATPSTGVPTTQTPAQNSSSSILESTSLEENDSSSSSEASSSSSSIDTSSSSYSTTQEKKPFKITGFYLVLIIIVLITALIILYLVYKIKKITRFTPNKIKPTYLCILNLLSLLKITKRDNETIREFFTRLYELDFIKENNSTEENSIDCEKSITAVENYFYFDKWSNEDMKALGKLYTKVNNKVLSKYPYIIYVIIWKKPK